MLIVYLAIVATASYWVIKTLGPEMAKPPLVKTAVRSGPTRVLMTRDPEPKIEKLEVLLADKNKSIELLQMELKVLQAQSSNFDKVRGVLEEEIQRLKELNRIFRSELGLPPIMTKESSLAS